MEQERNSIVQTAHQLLCQVAYLFYLSEPSTSTSETAQHWLNEFLSGGASAARVYSSRADQFGIRLVQEIEPIWDASSQRLDNEDACTRCLDSDSDAEDQEELDVNEVPDISRVFLWFVYETDALNYKLGLLYCTRTGRWVQFATDKSTDQLLDSQSGLFDTSSQHLPISLHRVLSGLRQSLVQACRRSIGGRGGLNKC